MSNNQGHDVLRFILNHQSKLNLSQYERRFLASVASKSYAERDLSDRQIEVLVKISQKIKV